MFTVHPGSVKWNWHFRFVAIVVVWVVNCHCTGTHKHTEREYRVYCLCCRKMDSLQPHSCTVHTVLLSDWLHFKCNFMFEWYVIGNFTSRLSTDSNVAIHFDIFPFHLCTHLRCYSFSTENEQCSVCMYIAQNWQIYSNSISSNAMNKLRVFFLFKFKNVSHRWCVMDQLMDLP